MKLAMTCAIVLLPLFAAVSSAAGGFRLETLGAGILPAVESVQPPAPVPAKAATFRRVEVGPFRSRGLYAAGGEGLRPAILLLPGSGPNGPEGMVPEKYTLGKNGPVPLLLQAAQPFINSGFHTLSLGKPGVDFWPEGAGAAPYYDVEMMKKDYWPSLLENAAEGLDFLRAQPGVDPARVWILGLSEGTQVAAEIAAGEGAAGLILLGYSGEDLVTTYRWQISDRQVDAFIRPDVDKNKDGFVSRTEAKCWPEFRWPWEEGQEKVSIEEILTAVRAQAEPAVERLKADPSCGNGYCERGPSYSVAASFPGPVYVFTGELDVRTRPREALALKAECARRGKKNCAVEIVPGVQHAFSPPRPPRGQPFLDETLGPVGADLLARLEKLAGELASGANKK